MDIRRKSVDSQSRVKREGMLFAFTTKELVTNYGEGGGATEREGGGHVKFYPYEKGGCKKF